MNIFSIPRSIALTPALLLLISCGSGGDGDSSSNEAQYLYSQDAERGRLDLSPDGTGTLSLSSVSDKTLFFQDRTGADGVAPQAGTVDTEAFIAQWANPANSNNFAINPPNAAIEYKIGKGEIYNFAFQLSDPSYNKARATLSYQVKLIEPGAYGDLSNGVHLAISDVGVFIDDGDYSGPVYKFTINLAGEGNPDAHMCVIGQAPSWTETLDSRGCGFVAKMFNHVSRSAQFNAGNTRIQPGFSEECENSVPILSPLLQLFGCYKARNFDGPGFAINLQGYGDENYTLCVNNGPQPYFADWPVCLGYVREHDRNFPNYQENITVGARPAQCNLTASLMDLANYGCIEYQPLY